MYEMYPIVTMDRLPGLSVTILKGGSLKNDFDLLTSTDRDPGQGHSKSNRLSLDYIQRFHKIL